MQPFTQFRLRTQLEINRAHHLITVFHRSSFHRIVLDSRTQPPLFVQNLQSRIARLSTLLVAQQRNYSRRDWRSRIRAPTYLRSHQVKPYPHVLVSRDNLYWREQISSQRMPQSQDRLLRRGKSCNCIRISRIRYLLFEIPTSELLAGHVNS